MAAAERGEGEPSECDLAKHSGIEVGKIRSLLQLRNIGVSIDDPLYEDGDTSLQDTLLRCLSAPRWRPTLGSWGFPCSPSGPEFDSRMWTSATAGLMADPRWVSDSSLIHL